MIVDGIAIAADILSETKARVETLGRTPVVRAITAGPSPATLSYLKIKAARATDAGMRLEVVTLARDATYTQYEDAIRAPGADAIIVQLPLPEGVDSEALVNTIPLSKDADVLSRRATAAFESQQAEAVLPPVVAAIAEVLLRTNTSVPGARAVVVGQGKLVGRPAAVWLEKEGAQVTTLTRESADRSAMSRADILILGAGSPLMVQPEHIKEGVVLIDAGTSEQGGQMVGDADPACAQKALVFTPVPGGMGPIAVACLFRNVVSLLERSLQEQ
jgi:methylenetetrahydrofolate dehydrogenase (NADP+) / methenyltetrahydrofolate cyclohydrolase